LALIEAAQKKYNQAMQTIDSAEDFIKSLPSKQSQYRAQMAGLTGVICRDLGQTQQALKHLERSE
jgi:flagellar biosynthesis chaperone FliJ